MVDGHEAIRHGEIRQKFAQSDQLAAYYVSGGCFRRTLAHLEDSLIDQQQRRQLVDARKDRSLHCGRRVRL